MKITRGKECGGDSKQQRLVCFAQVMMVGRCNKGSYSLKGPPWPPLRLAWLLLCFCQSPQDAHAGWLAAVAWPRGGDEQMSVSPAPQKLETRLGLEIFSRLGRALPRLQHVSETKRQKC